MRGSIVTRFAAFITGDRQMTASNSQSSARRSVRSRVACSFLLSIVFLSPICLSGDSPIFAAEPGLVAHWNFDEGQGTVARDQSGNGNDGMVHDAKWLKNETGYCLELDGQTSWVDCGGAPALICATRLRWKLGVFPTGQPRGEPGILGKQFESYLVQLTTPTATPGSTSDRGE